MEVGYSITDLVAATGYRAKTIHHMVADGKLPAPTGGRRYARYDARCMTILLGFRRLQDERVTQADLVERYTGMAPVPVRVLRSAQATRP